MTIKTAILATSALLAAAAPMTITHGSDALYRLQVSCAQASAIDTDSEIADGNSGCEPAAGYVCTTPRADYLDKRPI